jgi:hypothetical protein
LPRSPRNNLVVVRTAARRELEAAIRRYIDITKERLKPAHATINRELAALRRAFAIAVEQARLSAASVPRVKLFAEHNARQGFVERTDFDSVVSRLAPYLQDYTWFAYGSGWRKAEVATLAWPAADKTSTRVTLRREHSKNGEPRVLPLMGELAEIIDRRRQDPYVHDRPGRNCGVAVHLPSKRRPDRRLPQGLDGGMHRGRFCQAEAPSRRSPGARPQGTARHAPDADLPQSSAVSRPQPGGGRCRSERGYARDGAPDHQRLSALPDRLRRRRARGARADASRARERRRGPGAGWAGAQFGAQNGSRDTLAGSKSLISKAGSWCSLVSTLDCQSRGRGFKSRRARH